VKIHVRCTLGVGVRSPKSGAGTCYWPRGLIARPAPGRQRLSSIAKSASAEAVAGKRLVDIMRGSDGHGGRGADLAVEVRRTAAVPALPGRR